MGGNRARTLPIKVPRRGVLAIIYRLIKSHHLSDGFVAHLGQLNGAHDFCPTAGGIVGLEYTFLKHLMMFK